MAKGGYAAVVLLFLLVGAGSACGQSQKRLPHLSVTILLDLSYSMRLPLSLNRDAAHSTTRLDQAKGLLRSVIDGSAPDTQWSLLTFGGTQDAPSEVGARIRQGFTSNRKQLESEITHLSTWGVSPLAEAMLYAAHYSVREAPASRRVLLVVSDGIGTVPSLFVVPSPRTLDTRVVFAGIVLRHSSGLMKELEHWTAQSGGIYVNAADTKAVRNAVFEGDQGSLSPIVRPRMSRSKSEDSVTQGSVAERHAPAAAPFPRGLPRRRLVLILIPLPLLLLGVFLQLNRRRAAQLQCRRVSVPIVRFRYETRDDIEERELSQLPAELSLGGSGGSTAPVVEMREGRVHLISATPILVNGVAVRRAGLREGDRIRIGPVLWTYRGVALRAAGPPPPTKNMPLAAAAATAVAAAVLLIVGLGPARNGGGYRPGLATSPAAGRNSSGTATGPGAGIAAGADARGSEHPGYVALAGRPGPVHPFVHTTMIAPGERPHFFKADVMFIHAHPDDNSIDFGALMAIESRAGRRIVAVVFTDGNAGLDQFPNRRVGGIYPSHALKGSALAVVRVEETERALSILGAQEYIRLGLLNNPYDSITEVLPLHTVLRRWGGEAPLVRKLAALIEGFRPEIVVSPDEHHPGVFEHFEHEAVGYLTNRALSYLDSRGEDPVRAHLITVDPMLTSRYKGVFGVNVMALAPRSGLTYRTIQVAALKEHATQRDASVIAVEVLPNFAEEYYVARSWNLAVSPSRYFAGLIEPNGG